MKFKSLKLGNWKQFKLVELDLHPNVTIITGANGAGKTTILNIFARHFGWNLAEVATPIKNESGSFSYSFEKLWKGFSKKDRQIKIGEIQYTSGLDSEIVIPAEGNVIYQPEIPKRQHVAGLSIPSHRSFYSHTNIQHVSTAKRSKQQAFDLTFQQQQNRYHNHGIGQPVNHSLKETLIAWAVFGGGNKFIEPDQQQDQFFVGFQQTLKNILPEHLGFEAIVIRGQNDVVLKTLSGDFVVDAVSGGLSAIIDLAWQIYLRYTKDEQLTVVIDEVENHLHASMQRRLLPNFIKAFPGVQFIVSTHSPLVVGSVQDSAVYALRYDEKSQVFSTRLDLNEKAKAASDILREVLDVPVTFPIWIEQEINDIVSKYQKSEMDTASIAAFKEDLVNAGLQDMTTEAFIKLAEGGSR